MLPKTIIHLLSGGMDSVTLLYDLHGQKQNVHCMLFDYKQRHLKELEFAKWHCERLKVLYTLIELPQLRGSKLTDGSGGVVVPNRNAIFLSLAVNLAIAANANTVTFAVNKEDEIIFPDCRKPFVDAMNASTKAAGYSVEICAPYLDKAKWWIGGKAQEMGVPLEQTWTCYEGGEKPCGQCIACSTRNAALAPRDEYPDPYYGVGGVKNWK